MDVRVAWIWLQQALGPGCIRAGALLREMGDALGVYRAPEEALLPYVADRKERDRLLDRDLSGAQAIFERTRRRGMWLLTPDDDRYPELLRGLPDLPLVLYGKGVMPDLRLVPPVAVAGTRRVSDHGAQAAQQIADGLVRGGAAVVAGAAVGVEAIAHAAALDAGGVTITVQPCGLDVEYPPENTALRERVAREGALVSEYPPGTERVRESFRLCNRLISGMSLGVCLVEAGKRSGSLTIAAHAREQGRDVFAVAGDFLVGRSPGTDRLIREGARLATGAGSILEEYLPLFPDILDPKAESRPRPAAAGGKKAPETPPAQAPKAVCRKALAPEPAGLSEPAHRVFAVLREEPQLLAEIAAAAELPVPEATAALTELEMTGAAGRMPGQRYARRTVAE